MTRVRVIWNRNAGVKAGFSTNNELREVELRDLLRRHGLGSELVPTATATQAVARTQDALRDGYDVVVAAGGDGTVREVAEVLVGTETALGVLPLGSVMNVARAIGVPRELDAAAAVIARGATRRMDVGLANGRPFFEAATIGLHAELFEEGDRFDRGDRRALVRAIVTALRYRPSRMRIRLDDRTLSTRALVTFVANGPYAGLGFTVAPGAALDDGRFDVRVFARFSRLELLTHFWSIAAGKRRYEPRVRTFRSSRVRIESARPLPARADGEPLGTTPVEFELRPAALRVLVPEP